MFMCKHIFLLEQFTINQVVWWMAVAGRTMHKEAFMFTAWEYLSQTLSSINNGKLEKHSEDAHVHQGQFIGSIDTKVT